jgi:hypothetical protein
LKEFSTSHLENLCLIQYQISVTKDEKDFSLVNKPRTYWSDLGRHILPDKQVFKSLEALISFYTRGLTFGFAAAENGSR